MHCWTELGCAGEKKIASLLIIRCTSVPAEIDFPHLQVQSKKSDVKVTSTDRAIGPWTPMGYTIAGPRAMGMMTDSSSASGGQSEKHHQYLRAYDSMSMSTLASLHRNAAAETTSLDSNMTSSQSDLQRSPNGSMTSIDSSASTITSASRVAAKQYRRIRRQFDAMSVTSNNLSDKEKERLSRIASKLRRGRGSMTSLNTVSSSVPMSTANTGQITDSEQQDCNNPQQTDLTSMSQQTTDSEQILKPLQQTIINNTDSVSVATLEDGQKQGGMGVQLPAHLAVSQQSFREAMNQQQQQQAVVYI